MYALKSFLLLVALYLVLVAAHPVQHVHHRVPRKVNNRRSCKGDTDGDQSLVVETSSSVHSSTVKSSPPAESSPPPKSSSSPKPSSSSSSDKPDSTSPASSGGGVVGSLKALFPITQSKAWTTSPESDSKLPLSDSTFRLHHELKALPHPYVKAPDGKLAMRAHYPKNSLNFGNTPQGGFSFYAPGPSDVDLTTAKEATFGYSVFFEEGFKWVLGGKLPGMYGGDSEDSSVSCSGGSRSDKCFSVRLMWRENGDGEFYTYLPPMTDSKYAANKKVCNVAPKSDCNDVYGASVGRGSFKFKAGAWTTVSERVRLNDVGQANGEIQLFVNGKSVINVSGLILRAHEAGRLRGIQAQTFFGGSHDQFRAVQDSNAYFSDFSVAITEKL